MNVVQAYTMPVASATTSTTQIFVGHANAVNLFVPALATWYGSSTANLRMLTSYTSAVTAKTAYFYDYANKAPNECVITITTGGMYEIPNASGGGAFVKIEFDVACTKNTAGMCLTTCKISF